MATTVTSAYSEGEPRAFTRRLCPDYRHQPHHNYHSPSAIRVVSDSHFLGNYHRHPPIYSCKSFTPNLGTKKEHKHKHLTRISLPYYRASIYEGLYGISLSYFLLACYFCALKTKPHGTPARSSIPGWWRMCERMPRPTAWQIP